MSGREIISVRKSCKRGENCGDCTENSYYFATKINRRCEPCYAKVLRNQPRRCDGGPLFDRPQCGCTRLVRHRLPQPACGQRGRDRVTRKGRYESCHRRSAAPANNGHRKDWKRVL